MFNSLKIKTGKKIIKQKRGFALLFSVLVSSLLLTIGLSIMGIALKEADISSASRQSFQAFYAADSGREYIRYRDTVLGDISTFDENDFTLGQDITNCSVDIEDVCQNEFLVGDSGPNFVASIEKKWLEVPGPGVGGIIGTTITVRGYDSNDGDQVERAIEQTY